MPVYCHPVCVAGGRLALLVSHCIYYVQSFHLLNLKIEKKILIPLTCSLKALNTVIHKMDLNAT